MSEMAKKAREAMKNKAKRLGSTDPHQKVDASSWTPPEPLNADVKTGLRPVSRRAYKKGGKVEGMAAKMHAGRKPRKNGGEASMYANAKINRNVKDANEEREGTKHIGGMKKGGRAYKNDGGSSGQPRVQQIAPGVSGLSPEQAAKWAEKTKLDDYKMGPGFKIAGPGSNPLDKNREAQKKGGRACYDDGGPAPRTAWERIKNKLGIAQKSTHSGDSNQPPIPEADREAMRGKTEEASKMKKGGRAKKQMGGPMMGAPMAGGMAPNYDPRLDMVKRQAMNFQGNPVTPGAKKGGKIESHPDEAMDKALIKKMVKKEARTGKAHGGMKRMNRKDGGMALDGELQGTRPTGGRLARKDGGRAKGKGKTDINIIISSGPKAGPGIPPGLMPPAGPPGMPPMNPQAVGAAAPVMTGPPPGPMPGPGPAMPPGMGMPRKSGGRITPKAKSFADMKAGAGSGEGRLQKTDIAEYKRSKHRAGGKVYRTYKDMDAGAGSGLGRLEKTEIQSRKH